MNGRLHMPTKTKFILVNPLDTSLEPFLVNIDRINAINSYVDFDESHTYVLNVDRQAFRISKDEKNRIIKLLQKCSRIIND